MQLPVLSIIGCCWATVGLTLRSLIHLLQVPLGVLVISRALGSEPQAALSTKSPVCRVLPPCSGVLVNVAITHGGGGGKVGGSGPTQAPPLSTARGLTL